ncbi:MAG: hypothetical protein ACJAS4_001441 [Bacteriovoracaceae bacterium]|jgi:hypothetical protein
MKRLKENKALIIFSLCSLMVFILFFKSFQYTLYSDEATYLAESLSISKMFSELGFYKWLIHIFSFDHFTSTRFAALGSFWPVLFGEDYKLAHIFSNSTYFLIFITSLFKTLKGKLSNKEVMLKVAYLATVPIIAFSSLWYLKDISFISLGLLCFVLFENYNKTKTTKSFMIFISILYVCVLVRPLFSMIVLIIPFVLNVYLKNSTGFIKRYRFSIGIMIFYSILVMSTRMSVFIKLQPHEQIFASFLIVGIYIGFVLMRGKTGIKHSVVGTLLLVPIVLVFYPSLLRFIYATVFTQIAIETTGVFNFSTTHLKVFNCFLGFNGLMVLYFIKSFRIHQLSKNNKILITYFSLFSILIFTIIPEYDFRLLIPSFLVFLLFCIRQKTSLNALILGVFINILSIGLLYENPKFTKKIYESELQFENLALEIGKMGIVSRNIEVIGGRAFTGNISKLRFYMENYNLDNTVRVISPRIKLEDKINIAQFIDPKLPQILLLGPEHEGDPQLMNLFKAHKEGTLGLGFELLKLKTGEKFLFLNKGGSIQ